MEIERLDYSDAIKKISEEYHIDLWDFESKWKASPEYQSDKEKFKRITKLAQDYFVQQLVNSEAYSYLINERKLDPELITQLWLGYAPSQNQAFFAYFQRQGFGVEDLLQLGLAKKWSNEIYAFFRDRLIIPIKDSLGSVIAFGARALHADQEPKYLNSAENILYDKSSTLYGIDHLKLGVKEHKSCIIVEWYFDVIALKQGGYDIGIATCGTSLTEKHITTLKRYTDTMYFLFDNDGAGTMATLRWLSIAYTQGVYPKIISLANWLDNQITKLPKDIDDLVRDNPHAQENIAQLLSLAQDGFLWAIDHFAAHYHHTSPIERQKALNGLFDLIHSVNSLSTQHLFIEQIAQHFHIDYTLLLSQYRQYIKQEKRVFWPAQRISSSQREQHNNSRIDQKLLLLQALLYNDCRKSLKIDEQWISDVKLFVNQIGAILPDHDQIVFEERQLRREKETTQFIDQIGASTTFAKQVLWPTLLGLQKTALKQADDKEKIIELGKKLR